MRFEWDADKAAEVAAQRGITLDDAIAVFFDADAYEEFDEDHSTTEERYRIIGLSAKGLLTVVYTVMQEGQPDEVYRIITAWHATTSEEKRYEGK